MVRLKKNWGQRKDAVPSMRIQFSDIFQRYLTKAHGKTCLEIGCVPGSFLGYIAKNFGYYAEGVDNVKNAKKTTEQTLRNAGINECTIYEEDFISWKSPKKYDLIGSFGFIEHFTGGTLTKVVRKHVELLEVGGTLIIDVPNFKYGQYVIHYFLDRKNLKQHNISIMNLNYFKQVALNFNLKVLHLSYYGGFFDFWVENPNKNFIQRIAYKLLEKVRQGINKTRFKNVCNKFFSPYIVFVCKKEENI